MSKRPMGHGNLRNMVNFKAVAIDYAYYLSLSDQPVSICITPRQMYVLSVQNTYTAWLTRWYNTEDITQTTVQYIAAEIEELLMCGCGVPAPTLTDRLNSITYNNTTSTTYQNTENTWNAGGQTVSSIAPNLDWDTGDPVDIAKVTCSAIRNILNAIMAQGKTMNGQTLEQNKDLVGGLGAAMGGLATAGGAALAAGGVAAAAVGFFGGPYLILGLALGAVGTGIATLFMSADNSLFENTEAIDKVACAMITNTGDGSMTRSKFQGALSPNDFAPGSPEAQIAAMVQPFLDDLNVYLQFMVTGNQLYDAADIAALPDCGCEPDLTCYDFKTGKNGWDGPAEYFPGEGFGRNPGNPSRMVIAINIGPRLVRRFVTKFNRAWEGWTDVRSYPYGSPTYRRDATGAAIRDMVFDPPIEMSVSNIDNGRDLADIPEDVRLIEVCIDYVE